MDGLYAVMNIVAPLLLGAVLLYAVLANRKKRSAADLAQTEKGTRELREELNREDKAREHETPEASAHASSGAAPAEDSSGKTSRPNISTEHQPVGSARNLSDTLDQEPKRDPLTGGAIPGNYDPATSKRIGDGPTVADAEAQRVAQEGRRPGEEQ